MYDINQILSDIANGSVNGSGNIDLDLNNLL
ncbi:hypothetical protein EV207_16017 [Scopulibacillus darangshiensis]|uniref:Uncharacterized protein n=1 Tax=Scopulibacillus darangshiensis TaxID=442528 RepID=A0A4R2NEK9_9BACL|nr:hypothetical protein EV207_16017 [Scopulibacillus darangshiensis]